MDPSLNDSTLPLVLAGPILRRVTPERLCIWLATSAPVRVRVELEAEGTSGARRIDLDDGSLRILRAGDHLHYVLIDLALDESLPVDTYIAYDLHLQAHDDGHDPWHAARDWAPDLCHEGHDRPFFRIPSRVASFLHGSCRKPHHPGDDALAAVDGLLARARSSDEPWPSFVVLTGDQIYADEVAGPLLWAIHQLIPRLGLPAEPLPETGAPDLDDADALYRHPKTYYGREGLLPSRPHNRALVEILFGGVEKPIFTSASAQNHLITLGEVLAMYLLAWSPVGWEGLDLEPPPGLDPEHREEYDTERAAIEEFVRHLPAVRRVFAHLPVAMIFDDHDVTDDWNLSREWEEIAYGHDFSRRVIGNALIGYAVHQGWGNRPEAFGDELVDTIAATLEGPGTDGHDDLIQHLLRFEQWDYQWHTSPPLVVIDSLTRRWRSEVAARQPSGLLDWEALTDMQRTLRDLPAVLLVSPAPVFGVKLIEAIQRVFTWLGKPLMVDAENWMAHPGAAHAILNIFRHRRTPKHFVILSGDVHYSFVYDVELRGRERGPDIWQICSSGVRNEFPPTLLDRLDRANRWLYSPRSPLNWFTRRRRMRVIPRKPEGTPSGRRLLNGSSIGLVELDGEGVPTRIRDLMADGRTVEFTRREDESRWD